MAHVTIEACERADRPPSLSFFIPLFETTRGLLADDGLLFGFPEIDVTRQWGLEEGVLIRKYLRNKARFLSNAEELTDIWAEKVIRIFEGILGYIPEDAFPPDDETDAKELTFQTPFLDRLDNPAEVIERTALTMFDDDIVNTGLFQPIRERIDTNALLASGITPEIEDRTTRSVMLPTEARGRSPRELVEMYLRGTAFAELFRYELPFTIPTTARFEHCHICGGTGHGKTQALQSLIYDDLIRAKEGAYKIVVHGACDD